MANTTPTEAQEQAALAEWLEWQGVAWMHCPNEGKRSRITGHNLKRQGMKPGFPDVLVFTPPSHVDDLPECAMPPARGQAVKGTAIELKRRKGGQLQASQREWLNLLHRMGWVTAVCKGADEAIELLQTLGYGKRSA